MLPEMRADLGFMNETCGPRQRRFSQRDLLGPNRKLEVFS